MRSPSPWRSLHLILLFLQLLISCKSSSISELFGSWCQQYGKNYASEPEREQRFKVFQENYRYIVHHNTDGNSSYTLALNAFADLSSHEFRAKYLGLSPSLSDSVIRLKRSRPESVEQFDSVEESDIPSSVDWLAKGAVTEVKDQGSCGSRWAFSVTGAVEGINKIVTGSLVSLSEQELLDCDTTHNRGCQGGLIDYAFNFIIQNRGIAADEDYPYRQNDGYCNKYKMNKHVVTIDGYNDIPAKDELRLKWAVANQPVSVGICGSERSFQFYSRGVYSGPCSTSLDHAALIVGYGTEGGKDYWIVKNSWGRTWGLGGYSHMIRNTGSEEGICGINMLASHPIKTNRNPPPIPEPFQCGPFTFCTDPQVCCCRHEIFGICLWRNCCELKSDACCKNPVCDNTGNKCLEQTENATLEKPFSKRSFSAM